MQQQTVKIAKSVTPAIPGISETDKVLYYLIIGEGDDKVIINIGEKTHLKVSALLYKAEPITGDHKAQSDTFNNKERITNKK